MHLAEKILLIPVLLNATRENTRLKLCWQSWELLPFTSFTTACQWMCQRVIIVWRMSTLVLTYFTRLVIVLLTMDSSFAVGQKCDKWSHFLVRLKRFFFKSQAWSRHQLNYSQVQMNLSFYSETLCRFGLVSSFLISQCVVLMSCYGAVRDAWCILKTLHSSVGPVIALKRCCWWVKCLAPQGGHAKKKKIQKKLPGR